MISGRTKGHGTHLEVRLGTEQRASVKEKKREKGREEEVKVKDKCWFVYDISLKAVTYFDT